MLTYNNTTIGTITIKLNGRRFNLQIRQGNCLAVIIHERKATEEEIEENPESKVFHTLYSFFCDGRHMKNIIKDNDKLFGDDVVNIKLNMFYKENYTLLKYFMLSGYKVNCFYKEDK